MAPWSINPQAKSNACVPTVPPRLFAPLAAQSDLAVEAKLARMSIVFTQVKDRDRSTLRQRGPCLTCRAPNIQYGKGKGRGLVGAHVVFGDPWLERKLVTPMAEASKPFAWVD